VGQVAALEEVHSHEDVAGLHQGLVDGPGWRRRQRGLDVDEDVLGADGVVGEEFGAAALGQTLHQWT
jgi:hypothetical protein